LRSRLLLASSLALTLLVLTHPAWAWSNGGFSADPNNPKYGTHDWIAERALDWIPGNEKALVLTYRAVYLYGTELPDNSGAADGIGDTGKHHVYYRSTGALQDDAAAVRARDMQNQAVAALQIQDYALAAKWTGAMTHYIDDVAVFGHVMGSAIDWGSEHHHSDYEDHIQDLTNSPDATAIALVFDGTLAATSPYDAALNLARDTTFDLSGAGRTATWMDQQYNWSDPVFVARAYQSLNLAVNYVAEAVHDVWSNVVVTTTASTGQLTTSMTVLVTTRSQPIGDHVVIDEVEQNPPGDDSDHEWLVLYNPTEANVDISGWRIQATHGRPRTYAIPMGVILSPGGSWNVTFAGQFLDNEDESVMLLNVHGQIVDTTPLLTDTADGSNHWQRSPQGSGNWIFMPEFPWPAFLAFLVMISALVMPRRRSGSSSRLI
jgi:hypothetical protein